MPFSLTIGTERATALQNYIQDELTKRGYSPDADPVMAEYITIMIINNKSPAQITSELEDLIGTDFDPSFTDWLFIEAAKGASPSDSPSLSQPLPPDQSDPVTAHDSPPHLSDNSRRLPNAPRNAAPLYQQAISQVLPGNQTGPKKRAASARSPSPGPNKSRRTDLPTGPRAMLHGNHNPRSLIERVGGLRHASPVRNGAPRYPRDDIQARIDSITSTAPDALGVGGAFPQQNAMGDMGPMAMAMGNPLLLQEMMMSNMALMAQMASSMGLLGGMPPGQFPGGPGFQMQGAMPGDVGVYPGGGMNNGFSGPSQSPMRGVNSGRGGRGSSRGRGGRPSPAPKLTEDTTATPAPQATIAAPTPTPAAAPANPASSTTPALTTGATPSRSGFVPPERPQSPTLCKYGLKCTNAHCRFSHPSPVATAESGVVLSNEACEKGKDCKDKDCIKAHVSPAVLTAPATLEPAQSQLQQQSQPQPASVSHSPIPCRFGAACTRPNCAFTHPGPRHFETQHVQTPSHFAQQCRFGAGCTRATCPFQHPPGRVLPSTFHRGLSTSAPLVNVPTPETGSMRSGTSGPHRSVTFNHPSPAKGGAKDLERRVREVEERKQEAEKAVKEAEAAAVGKKDESKVVTITA